MNFTYSEGVPLAITIINRVTNLQCKRTVFHLWTKMVTKSKLQKGAYSSSTAEPSVTITLTKTQLRLFVNRWGIRAFSAGQVELIMTFSKIQKLIQMTQNVLIILGCHAFIRRRTTVDMEKMFFLAAKQVKLFFDRLHNQLKNLFAYSRDEAMHILD